MSIKRKEVSIKAKLPDKSWDYVCEDCGSNEVEEKVYVSMNDYLTIDGKSYFYITGDDIGYKWCPICNDEKKRVIVKSVSEQHPIRKG